MSAENSIGQQNRSALSSAVDDALNLSVAYGKAHGGIDAANLSLVVNRDKLIDAGVEAGVTKQAMEGYLNQLGLTPEAVKTQLELAGGPEAVAQLDAITQTRVVDIIANVRSGATKIGSDISLAAYLGSTGTNRWGGITEYAMGGVRRYGGSPGPQHITSAGVYAGDLIRFAEPATGKEAYVPFRGDSARSVATLGEAASWFGKSLVDKEAAKAGMFKAIARPAGLPAQQWENMRATRAPAQAGSYVPFRGTGQTKIEAHFHGVADGEERQSMLREWRRDLRG